MTPEDYIKEAKKTTAENHSEIRGRLTSDRIDLLHAAIGLATESGEILDNLKKEIYYGSNADTPNIVEEIGDICWYLSLALNTIGISFEDAMEININKLRLRYGDKFDKDKALNRDLESERKLLEGRK